ncbi:MAG: thiamine pyrophosphate-dependent enzyme, partial [Gammaproteobacteria bacterium]
FPLGDPIDRLKAHLITLGEWSQSQHEALEQELVAHVAQAWQEALSYGTMTEAPRLDPATMFDDVFKTATPALERQRAQFAALNRSK